MTTGPGLPHRTRPAQDPRPDTGTTPPPRADLTALLFRALYPGYDLHVLGSGLHVAVPRGAPCYAGRSIAAIAWQISQHAPGPAPSDTPAEPS